MAIPEYLAGWEKELIEKNAAEFRTIKLETPLDSIGEPPTCEFCAQPMAKAFVSFRVSASGDHDDQVHLIVGTENMPAYLCTNNDCLYVKHEENDDHSQHVLLSSEGCLEMDEKMAEMCLALGLNKAAEGFKGSARLEKMSLSKSALPQS